MIDLKEAISNVEWWKRKSTRQLLLKISTYVILITGSIVILIPLLWMISTALKSGADVYSIPPKWIPSTVVWSNFIKGWTYLPFNRFLGNTIFITSLAILGQLTSLLVAFGFARLRFPGRDILFLVLLCTMMLPGQVTLIPIYTIFHRFGWINTFKPLIVPNFLGGNPLFIFLARQFFMTIPLQLDEAAKIDGCSILGIFWRIALPIAKPMAFLVIIFTFMGCWQDFMGPLIYLNSMEKYTLALGLQAFQADILLRTQQWELLMAVSLITLIPPLLLFFFAQKFFIQGIVITGVKG